MLVVDVFFYVIKYFKDYLLKEYEDWGMLIKDLDIYWVLIVLVIWDDLVK